MTRSAVRPSLMFGCLVTLSLLHLLWNAEANQSSTVDASVLDSLVARNIGPANMSGRVTDIEVVESNTKIAYVATASGGLWKTTDGAFTLTPVFDNQSSVCIGDVAVSKSSPDVVWVGTGEHNPRNSVAWGDGVYKSTDGGKTWQHMGLKDSHSTGRMAIHPTNPDIVYVGALGHLWGPNKERGVFKTIDGGKTWSPSLFIDEDTGIVDLQMDPSDPNTLYAAAYAVRRDGFSGGNPAKVIGPKAGIYKTSNAGKTWEKLDVATPQSQYGRCGISIYRKNPNTVFALIQTDKTTHGNSNEGNSAGPGGRPELGGVYRSDDKGKTWTHLNTICPRPMYYGQIRVDPSDENRIYVLGVNTSISNDGGKTFGGKGGGKKGDPAKKDDPKKDDVKKDDVKKDEQKKDDPKGGKGGGGGGVHSDHHALWINPNDSNEVWIGTDGGFGVSSTRGQGYRVPRFAPLAQFYGIACDMSKPYYVYGGLQDNGSHGGPSATYDPAGIRQNLWFSIGGGDGFHALADPNDPNTVYSESQWGAFRRGNVAGKGGKGGKGEIDEWINFNLGQVLEDQQEADQKKDDQKKDDPKKDEQKKGGKGGGKGGGIRNNWSSPMHMSPHDSNTIFRGGHVLLMSTKRGDNFETISPDLTYGPAPAGKDVKGHTLFTIGESPKKKGVIWTGADDGRIMMTKDGGKNWTDVSAIPGVPKDRCVSRVEPSYFDEGGCLVSITRYRNDDRKPYVFKTSDFGANWQNISGDLPDSGSVHVVRGSSKNKDLLFCGTEFGLFTSFNGGQKWHRIKAGLPTVSVHDINIHPRERDLVLGTHGRGIWIIDDISPLEAMSPEIAAKPVHLFEVRPAVAFKWRPVGGVEEKKDNEVETPFADLQKKDAKDDQKKDDPTKKDEQKKGGKGGKGGGAGGGPGAFIGKNPPYGAIINFYLKAAGQPVVITIQDGAGKQIASVKGTANAGLNRIVWDLRQDGAAEGATVAPGDYTAVMQVGGQRQTQKVRVEAEPGMK